MAPPNTVRLGIGLYAAAELIGLVDFVLSLATGEFAIESVEETASFYFVLGIFAAWTAAAAVFLWFAYHGRSWARWGLVTLFVLALSAYGSMIAFDATFEVEPTDFAMFLYAIAVALLFSRPSREWFALSRAAAQPGS